jgi:asparagine synthase (glutamine-hydrolysing)
VEGFVSEPFGRYEGDPRSAAGYADLLTYLPNDILAKVDIASMANGLEVRCPFLDTKVVELALRMPSRVRRGKGVLRRAFRGLLPPRVLERPKMGFGIPLADWFRGELRSLVEDSMASLEKRGILEGTEIHRLLGEHRSGAADHGMRLWLLLILEIWLKQRV